MKPSSSSLAAPTLSAKPDLPSMFDVRCSMFDVRLTSLALVSICLFFTLSSAFGQGALTPPGPPGATMVTLSQLQLQSRIPISSAPATIARPGSYYFTTNLVCTVSNAIFINANGVTLDLNGFTLSSAVASAANGGTAILLNSGLSDITICNGHIVSGVTNNGSNVYSGSGFAYGIYYSGNPPVNVLVSHVSVSGCLDFGIYLYNGAGSTLVESCTIRTTGNYGILANTIKQSSATDCGGYAMIGDQVFDSRAQCTSAGNGISANGVAQNCYGYSSGGSGVSAPNAQNCYGESVSSFGVNSSTALNCFGNSNTYDGLVSDTAENCYGNSDSSGYGLYAYFVANGCYGYSSTGVGLDAFIASICHGAVGSGTALITTHNVNSY